MRRRALGGAILALLSLLALSAPALAVPSKPAVVRSGPGLPNLQWLLRNSLTGGLADITFVYGTPARGDNPVFGDWNGDGTDTIGVVRSTDGQIRWLLRKSNTGGAAEISAVYGLVATDFPVTGDWNDDATDTVGVVRGAQWLLRNSNTGGSAQVSFTYGSGAATELPLVWR
jgi:hypothetical protein